MKPKGYPQRKSPRLKDYDYAQNGAYFVTICTQNRLNLFGHIGEDGEISYNSAGLMLFHWWDELAIKYDFISLDAFVVMPNHLHAIIILQPSGDHAGSPLHTIVAWYKTMTTNAYIQGVKKSNWTRFNGKLWQRSFHDHIIRNETELTKLREYVLYNPSLWAEDKYHSDT